MLSARRRYFENKEPRTAYRGREGGPAHAAEALRQEIAQLRQRLEQVTSLRSEGRLRAVLDAALDAVIGMDASDLITYWNPRAEAIFGWRREEAVGRRLRDLIIPERKVREILDSEARPAGGPG